MYYKSINIGTSVVFSIRSVENICGKVALNCSNWLATRVSYWNSCTVSFQVSAKKGLKHLKTKKIWSFCFWIPVLSPRPVFHPEKNVSLLLLLSFQDCTIWSNHHGSHRLKRGLFSRPGQLQKWLETFSILTASAPWYLGPTFASATRIKEMTPVWKGSKVSWAEKMDDNRVLATGLSSWLWKNDFSQTRVRPNRHLKDCFVNMTGLLQEMI